MNPDNLLAKLADPSPSGASERLAGLLLDAELSATPRQAAVTGLGGREALDALGMAIGSPAAARWGTDALTRLLEWLDAHPGPIKTALPAGFVEQLESLARRPFTPDRALLTHLLGREPVRKMLRELLVDSLVAFGQKLRAPVADSRITRSLGELGKAAASRAGPLGSLASGMVDALSGEVERQVERLAVEFADVAVSRLTHRLVDSLCDPTRAPEQAALRAAVLEGLLAATGPQLAGQLRHDRALESIGPALATASAWLRTSDPEALGAWAERLAGPLLDRPVGELLADLGARESARAAVLPGLAARIRERAASDPFAFWLRAVWAKGRRPAT